MRGRREVAVAALLAASALCVLTVEVRSAKTGDSFYGFLVWNLFLAWIPLGFAAAAYAASRRGIPGAGVLLLLAGWILFFPNAPYVLTDFIHLGRDRSAAPLWYDALMISSFAWTALLLGLISLYLAQSSARRYVGAAWSWVFVLVSLLLASFGVYLGRFVRFNSWDALVRPGRVGHVITHQLENPIHHPRMIGILGLLTLFLLVAYVLVYALIAPDPKAAR
ncbi:MAG: DUF1361 domain-containing protein [Gaiellaceae bacterium]